MIAIKDFKMPRGCYECTFAVESLRMDCDYYCQAVKENPDVRYGFNKPDWCPLVDVPDMNVGKCSEFPNSSDCVSRQAAIDALEREKSLVERPITETRWFDFGLRKAQDVLSELPSARPELRRGEKS